ncbi:hypothetical protein V2J09_023431 [Rumex salicifolius]
MDENTFARCVEVGLSLSKRVLYSRDEPPVKTPKMEKSALPDSYLASAPMVYAMISDPLIVDNPDVPSYQPYVHGRCSPPALIPLHMYGVEAEVDCHLDTAFVTVSGSWRLHCVTGNRSSDCCVAIPMGEQGSVLGFEIEVTGKSYQSQLITVEDPSNLKGLAEAECSGFLKPHIFTIKIPKVDGGSKLSIKARWSQKLLYHGGQFSLSLPFSFPLYVSPPGKNSKREKILLNVNSGTETQIICNSSSHRLKELRRQVDKLGFLYEAEYYTWSRVDFEFSYSLSSSTIFGGILLQSPALNDFDQREIFSLHLFPGTTQNVKVFRKRIVFIIDISGSMKGAPIENVKQAISASLRKLDPHDSFNIIAFNTETYLFSTSMAPATDHSIENAIEWMSSKFDAVGNTNILLPLNQAMELLSEKSDAVASILLVTDGAVENERAICNVVKDRLSNERLQCPRISTFGIGSYCNHYFLQMLAEIGKGHYDASYGTDHISSALERLCESALSTILADINIDGLEEQEDLTFYPADIRDLSCQSPLLLSGRYSGDFPESIKVHGILADMSSFVMNLKARQAKDIPLDKVFAQRQMNVLTANAWYLEKKEIENQVAKMSLQTGVPCEYTRMVLFQTGGEKKPSRSITIEKPQYSKAELQQMIATHTIQFLPNIGLGFGDLKKTTDNVPPGIIIKDPDATELMMKATTNCCHSVLDRVCCMCCINMLSKVNNQCAIVASQLLAALACCECLECCYDLCS